MSLRMKLSSVPRDACVAQSSGPPAPAPSAYARSSSATSGAYARGARPPCTGTTRQPLLCRSLGTDGGDGEIDPIQPRERDHLDPGGDRGGRERTVGDDQRRASGEEHPLLGRVGPARREQRRTVGDDRDAVDPAQEPAGASVDPERAGVVRLVDRAAAGPGETGQRGVDAQQRRRLCGGERDAGAAAGNGTDARRRHPGRPNRAVDIDPRVLGRGAEHGPDRGPGLDRVGVEPFDRMPDLARTRTRRLARDLAADEELGRRGLGCRGGASAAGTRPWSSSRGGRFRAFTSGPS